MLSQIDRLRVERAGVLLEQAALDPCGLRSAFDEVATLLNAEMFHMYTFTHPEAPDIIVAPGREGLHSDYVLNGWHQHDIYSNRASKLSRHGVLLSDRFVVNEEEARRHIFYQEFCRKWGIGRFDAWTFDLAGEQWAYTVMPPTSGPRTADEAEILRRLMPAGDRAALLAYAIRDHMARGILEGLELGGRPALMLNHAGRVIHTTRSAEQLIGQGFFIRDGKLVGVHPATEGEFRKLTSMAGRTRAPVLTNFEIRRIDDERSILAMPISLRDRGLDGLPGARILLLLVDPIASSSISPIVLRDAFGFTSREAELANLISNSETVDSASARMGISVSTCRSMVKILFAKTGTRRQAELVSLLSQFPVQSR